MKVFMITVGLAAVTAATAQETIETTSGDVYHNAIVTELAPTTIAIQCDEGVMRLAPDKLPEAIQRKYGYLPKAENVVLEGKFESGPSEVGEVIEFKDGKFDYIAWGCLGSDHFTGRYTVQGHWIILHNPQVFYQIRVLASMDGVPTILTARNYQSWKETGETRDLTSHLLRKAP